jgi:prepilin-type N-terminal cleavage/methylation domain-containing protein
MLSRIRKSQEQDEGGFTLIELLVVIIIIGILAAIAIPTFLNQRKKGYDAQAKSDLKHLATMEETFLTENNHYGTLAEMVTLGFTASANSGAASATVLWRDSALAPTTTATAATGGYALCTTSAAGNTWVYDSLAGGLRPSGTACPSS